LLEDFWGNLQTDGNDGYNSAVAVNGLTHVDCMAHARRKFSESVTAQGKGKPSSNAYRGLALIKKLYRIEKQARKLKPEARYDHRLRHARPILRRYTRKS
jgi:transposase